MRIYKNRLLKLSFLFLLISHHAALILASIESSFVIVTASYNNKDWYKKNLDSVFSQNYSNYRLIYVDDCSADGTGDLVEQYIMEKGQASRATLVKNQLRKRAMTNIYNVIHSCDDKDIILILDGDDWLAHDGVLSYLNHVYSDQDVWITYGQYQEYPSNRLGFNKPIPEHVVKQNAFRQQYDAYSHLRTFYAGLFKKIKAEDLMFEGLFVLVSYDVAMMLPMMEMAGEHYKFIPDILYVYNGENVINDHKISKKFQRNMDKILRRRQPYEKIETLF